MGLLNNKKLESVLGAIKDFINKNGIPIQIDNEEEFVNQLFENYCNTNNIKIIRGGPYPPLSQGFVESFN